MRHDQDWTRFYQLAEIIARVCFVQRKSRDEWDEQVTFLFEMLSEYDFESVKKAMQRHVKTQKFFPTPADIVRLIEGSSEDRAVVAWRCFLQAVERFGYYDSVRFPDPAYHYVVEQLGGWERLGYEWHNLTDRDLQFRRAEWCRLYEIGLRVASWDDEPGKVRVPKFLRGYYERDNREGGYLEFVPDVIEISTGKRISRQALESPAQDNISALPTLEKETGTP